MTCIVHLRMVNEISRTAQVRYARKRLLSGSDLQHLLKICRPIGLDSPKRFASWSFIYGEYYRVQTLLH